MSILEFRAEDLPSRGISYPEGTIFKVQSFQWGEVQDLNTSNLSIETKVDNFIKATSINTTMKGEEIAYIDYIYMHLGRVSSVYGNNKLKAPLTCPFCGGNMTQDIEFKMLEINDISEYADIIPFTFEIQGEFYSFNFLTLEKVIKWFRLMQNIQEFELFNVLQKEYTEMSKEVEKTTVENLSPVIQKKWETLNRQYTELQGKMSSKVKARATKYKPYGSNALLLAFMCTDFGTEAFDNFLSKLYNKELSSETIEFLDFVEATLGVGLKALKTTCPHCSKMFSYSLEDNVNDVYPFRNSSTDIANKLRAMQAPASDTTTTEERGDVNNNVSVRKHSK